MAGDVAGINYLDASGPAGVRIYAIGDIHGRHDCLSQMHRLIEEETRAAPDTDWRVVHLGDYCDRGPDTRDVMERLIEVTAADRRVLALRGNHDQAFLQFLEGRGSPMLFVNFGGETTARSYGVRADFSSPSALEETRRRLNAAVPESHREFLRSLPYAATLGDFFFCHAGIQPQVPFDKQDHETLLWIRDEFLDWPLLHPKLIVHGHTPVPQPEVRSNRVDVDTMAFHTGRLTALVIEGSDKRFLTAACARGR